MTRLILKMPKFTFLIFAYCYTCCLFIDYEKIARYINFGILEHERRKIQFNFSG